jgi:hypothetical protein
MYAEAVVGRNEVKATAHISTAAVSLRNISYSMKKVCRAAFRTALKSARVVESWTRRVRRILFI